MYYHKNVWLYSFKNSRGLNRYLKKQDLVKWRKNMGNNLFVDVFCDSDSKG